MQQPRKPRSSSASDAATVAAETEDKHELSPSDRKHNIIMEPAADEEEQLCRVCRDGPTPDNPLYTPCLCSGSISKVHQVVCDAWRLVIFVHLVCLCLCLFPKYLCPYEINELVNQYFILCVSVCQSVYLPFITQTRYLLFDLMHICCFFYWNSFYSSSLLLSKSMHFLFSTPFFILLPSYIQVCSTAIVQECLLQWLEVSAKKECELCGHTFQMSPLYKDNAPSRLPVSEVMLELLKLVPMLLRMILAAVLWLVLFPILIWSVVSNYTQPVLYALLHALVFASF